jgi:cytochrome c oxidase assembly protein subunit 15
MLKDEIGIFHAWLAHGFLGLLVVIALATSQIWQRLGRAQTSRPTAAAILRVALITTVLVYLQLILGATMRHQHRDLSILDFPLAYGQLIPDVSPQRIAQINAWRDARALSDVTPFQIQLQMAHRLGAVVVAIGVVLTLGTMLRRSAETPTALGRIAAAWFCLMCTQIFLGAWTIWSNKAADVATAHVAMGATMLAVGVTICALSWRLRNNAERQAGLSSIALPEQLHAR